MSSNCKVFLLLQSNSQWSDMKRMLIVNKSAVCKWCRHLLSVASKRWGLPHPLSYRNSHSALITVSLLGKQVWCALKIWERRWQFTALVLTHFCVRFHNVMTYCEIIKWKLVCLLLRFHFVFWINAVSTFAHFPGHFLLKAWSKLLQGFIGFSRLWSSFLAPGQVQCWL